MPTSIVGSSLVFRSENQAVTFSQLLFRQISGAIAVGYDRVDCEWREKVSAFSLFLLTFVRSSNLPADVIKLYIRKARESFRTRTVVAV